MSNYKFKTTNIKGKQYVEVNERIKFFRQEDQYKNWSIQTDFITLTADEALCRCTITDAEGNIVAQGHAHELKANGNINKTSYVENCETSAVGRALGILGIGIDTSIASANEVENAIQQQEQAEGLSQQLKQTASELKGNIMDKAIDYIKSQKDKSKAYEQIIAKYGEVLTDKQKEGLKKFVR